MKVEELLDIKDLRIKAEPFDLKDVSINGQILHVGDKEIELDELGEKKLTSFLQIPYRYYRSLDPEYQNMVVNWRTDQWSESAGTFITRGKDLVEIFHGEQQLLPLKKAFEGLVRVFPEETEVARVNTNGLEALVDLVSPEIENAPAARQGDVTRGGLRVYLYSDPSRDSWVMPYLHRLVCSNGMVAVEEDSKLRVKGSTVDEVIAEMERLAQNYLQGSVPFRLERYMKLADEPVEHLKEMARAMMNEFGISNAIQERVLDNLGLAEIEGGTVYDLINVITLMQHEEVSERQRYRIMSLGGAMTGRTPEEIHSCVMCNSKL